MSTSKSIEESEPKPILAVDETSKLEKFLNPATWSKLLTESFQVLYGVRPLIEYENLW